VPEIADTLVHITGERSLKRAFTLVELLVVVGIIGVLVSLLLPGLSRAKQSARSVVCLSNLRQQGIALNMYVGENGAYPIYEVPPAQKFWAHFLEPYLHDKWPSTEEFRSSGDIRFASKHRVFACPGYDAVNGVYKNLPMGFSGAYGYNTLDGTPPFGGLSGVPLMLSGAWALPRIIHDSEVVSPSRLLAIGDSEALSRDGSVDNVPGVTTLPHADDVNYILNQLSAPGLSNPPRDLTPSDKAMKARHGGNWTMLSCDGHGESSK